MHMLDSLIGLDDIKKQIRKFVAFAKLRREMTDFGKKRPSAALNMEFVGNPGTAKTTVARITAAILHDAGLISDDRILEVGRADLVARYEGQTAARVKHIFEIAKGRVLFIDEAYSLLEEHHGEYGDEAISTIVQEMENCREDTVVIFAGYPGEMDEFFARNPGLRSRVPFRLEFSDYSSDELASIVELESGNRGFSIDPEAYGKLKDICKEAACRPELGNGRFCRNLIENAILNYALRIYGESETDKDNDFVLKEDDFISPASGSVSELGIIGFAA
jgi:SpoVK/Ycf46/Vps4 family AAA+-type ATPase